LSGDPATSRRSHLGAPRSYFLRLHPDDLPHITLYCLVGVSALYSPLYARNAVTSGTLFFPLNSFTNTKRIMITLQRENLDTLLHVLQERGYRNVGPAVRDGAIVLDQIRSSADLPVGMMEKQEGGSSTLMQRDDDALFGFTVAGQSWKQFLFPSRECLFAASKNGKRCRGSSDSYPFYQQSYNAVFCIERDFSPYYHSPNDLLQYLEIPYAKEIVKAGMAMLLVLDKLPPAVDEFVLRERGNGSSLFASWGDAAISDVHEYRVYLGQLPFLYDTSYVVSETSTTVPNLIEGKQYFVGVAGIDLTGREGLIVERTAVPRTIPLPPRSLTASPPLPRLNWRPGDEVDLMGYHVYRSVDSSQSFVRLTSEPVQDTTYTDSTSSQSSRWYFVTAIDSTAHESQPSDTIAFSSTVSVERMGFSIPSKLRLHQNFPNPFNPETKISYEIQSKAFVELVVTDGLGRVVATLVNEEQPPGLFRIRWDGSASSSGVYFWTLRAGSNAQTIRMMLLR